MLQPTGRNARSSRLPSDEGPPGPDQDASGPRNEDLLAAGEAARRLGISRPTLYDWLSQSDYGLLKIRGNSVSIDYLQGGPQGAGKIMVSAAEVERIRNLMRVLPQAVVIRRPTAPPRSFPGIVVPLGRPN